MSKLGNDEDGIAWFETLHDALFASRPLRAKHSNVKPRREPASDLIHSQPRLFGSAKRKTLPDKSRMTEDDHLPNPSSGAAPTPD